MARDVPPGHWHTGTLAHWLGCECKVQNLTPFPFPKFDPFSVPYVRIAAAWALVDSGDVAVAAPALAAPALAVLGEHAPWGKNDVFVSMAALTAIDRLGAKAAALHAPAQHWPATGPLPDARYAPYVPQLIKSTAAQAGTAPPVRKKKKV